MLEEYMDLLPKNVVERLVDLLHHERIIRGDGEHVIRRPVVGICSHQCQSAQSQLARGQERLPHRIGFVHGQPECDVTRFPDGAELRKDITLQRERWQCALPDDDGVHELDRDVQCIAPLRVLTENQQAVALVETAGEITAGVGDPFGVRLEEGRRQLSARAEACPYGSTELVV